MEPLQIVPSTTSHKHEPLVPALEVFARLGFHDLDLNLNHVIERGVEIEPVRRALRDNGQCVRIVSGGWCDFYDAEPAIQHTFASVDRQVTMTRTFGAPMLRLFFGRLEFERWTAAARQTIVANMRRLGAAYPDVLFVFENHDGASSVPEVCREVIEGVDRANVRLTFDPINFEHRGRRSLDAARVLLPIVGHVHLKGYRQGEFCAFGDGDVDLRPTLQALLAGGYRGGFTVEYEGPRDRTLHLYEGVRRARMTIDRLIAVVSDLPSHRIRLADG